MNGVERPVKKISATKDFNDLKKKKKIQLTNTNGKKYKPCYTHFHFIVKREPSKDISQSSVYLQYCIEEFLVNSEILLKYKEKVDMFTDGCFKHNKNYETQYWY